MNNYFSKQITQKEIKLIYKYMKAHIKEINNNKVSYFYKTKNYTITIFNNNKILIQGNNFENILKLIGENIETKNINQDLDKKKLIGSDESGTGDVFGGFVTCACYIPEENIEFVKKLGVKDSKELNNESIKKIFHKLNKMVQYEVFNIYPKEYNEMYNKFNNINTLKSYAHNLTINKICSNINFDYIIIDQFCSKEKYYQHLEKTNSELSYKSKLIFETKAENKYLEVAAASIIARYFFIKQIEELSKKIKINLPFGSKTNIVSSKLKLIEKNKLEQFCKLNFKTLKII